MKWIKESVKDLKTYPTPRKPMEVKLDSNEGKNICLLDLCEPTFLQDLRINLYPDGQSCLLREELGKYLGLPAANIVAGNGSSEMIDLIMKAFVEKGDKVLSIFPSFSMYGVFAKIYSAELVSVESRLDFSLDVNAVIRKAKESAPKAVFLCNLNNPTGYLLEKEEVEAIARATDALLVLDEAYMEFAYGSLAQDVTAYENLIVLRTMSKAFGLAGLRLGYLASNEGPGVSPSASTAQEHHGNEPDAQASNARHPLNRLRYGRRQLEPREQRTGQKPHDHRFSE